MYRHYLRFLQTNGDFFDAKGDPIIKKLRLINGSYLERYNIGARGPVFMEAESEHLLTKSEMEILTALTSVKVEQFNVRQTEKYFEPFPFSLEETQRFECVRFEPKGNIERELWRTLCPTCEVITSSWQVGDTGWVFSHLADDTYDGDEKSRHTCRGGVVYRIDEHGDLIYGNNTATVEKWLDTTLIHQ